MIDITNKAWKRDNEGLYFTIKLGPHTNNRYTDYLYGGFSGDQDFNFVDIAINYKNQLATGEDIVAVNCLDFELDNLVLNAGGTIAGNTFVRTGFINNSGDHFAIIEFLENLDESMAGIYDLKYTVTTSQNRVYANKFRVKIESVVDDFFSQRDGFKQSGGVLQNII